MKKLGGLAALILLFAALPLSAYTVYMKDGSKVVARDKYRIEGDRAYIVLPNGTETFVAASEIDVPRTERANRRNFGTAETLDTPTVPPPPGAQPATGDSPSLADLIARGQAGVGRGDTATPAPTAPPPPPVTSGSLSRTPAGFLDLSRLPPRPLRSAEVATEIQRYFRSQGFDEMAVYQGTTPKRPFVQARTDSEASVFRAMVVTAAAVLHLAETNPRQVEAIELLLTTSGGERAGQFVLTPEIARPLMNKQVDPATFFVRNVQF